MIIIKNSKKTIFILCISLSLFFTSLLLKNSILHLNCSTSNYEGFSKTIEANLLEQSLNKHFETAFSLSTPNELAKELRQLLKCQQKTIKKISNTTDLRLKELLINYNDGINKTLKNSNLNSEISFNNKIELNTKVLKNIDISLLKNLDEINETYNLNVYEDYSSYIKYLLYNYNESPNTYDSFIPSSDSYYYFIKNFY